MIGIIGNRVQISNGPTTVRLRSIRLPPVTGRCMLFDEIESGDLPKMYIKLSQGKAYGFKSISFFLKKLRGDK